jgi:hypothetical protein
VCVGPPRVRVGYGRVSGDGSDKDKDKGGAFRGGSDWFG